MPEYLINIVNYIKKWALEGGLLKEKGEQSYAICATQKKKKAHPIALCPNPSDLLYQYVNYLPQ